MSVASLPAAQAASPPGEPTQEGKPRGLWAFLLVQLFVVVWLQKIAIPGVGSDIALLFMSGGMLALAVLGKLQISPNRLLLYAIFTAVVVFTQIAGAQPFSAESVFLLIVTYLPLVIRFEVSWSLYLRLMKYFIGFMILISFIVLAEDAWQFVRGAAALPRMDRFLPDSWLVQGYTYVQSVYYGSPYIKPNAFFFREVSFVSQYCAVAIILEVVFFRRILVMVPLLACMFASFAGTGLLLLIIMIPFLFVRLPLRSVAVLSVVGVLIVVTAISTGWLGSVQRRITETSDPRSSSSMRFVYPIKLIEERLGDNRQTLTGVGAGNVYREVVGIGDLLPITKMLLEFGVIATIAYYAMIIYSLLDGAPSGRVALALFLLLNICGPYLEVSTIVFLMIVLGTILRPTGDKPPGLGAGRRSSRWRMRGA